MDLTSSKVSNKVFYPRPELPLTIYVESQPQYTSSYKIEVLIAELKECGPFVGTGKFGPGAYTGRPLKKKMFGHHIYYWNTGLGGSKRNEKANTVSFIILGAQKTNITEYVFFTMSDDITANNKATAREHRASKTDTKIYVTSHTTFTSYICALYPLLTGSELTVDYLYVQKLINITLLDSIIDQGVVEEQCNAIGQEIFNHFKQKYGNSGAGTEAVKRICDAVGFTAQDGRLRKPYISRAWDGIGDLNWRWRC